ncbi:MAG: hypothetical protein WDM70_00790 [Nitrosomonadales bacterium]
MKQSFGLSAEYFEQGFIDEVKMSANIFDVVVVGMPAPAGTWQRSVVRNWG